MMEYYIEPHDLVILGNRYESQLCAIEMEADCIIVCEGAAVSMTIRKLAQERGCTVMTTPYDAFTAARLINQSMPISYFMKTENLVTFVRDDYIEDIREVMASKRYRDFPVLDKEGKYWGMISRRNLLGARGKQVILVDHNEKSQAVDGVESAEIQEIIDHHKLGTIETISPVFFRNQPLGCTGTIIYQMYQEAGIRPEREIAGLLCSAIISDTLLFRSPHLHGGGQAGGPGAGGDRRHPDREVCQRNVRGGQRPEGKDGGGDLLSGFQALFRRQEDLWSGPDQLRERG